MKISSPFAEKIAIFVSTVNKYEILLFFSYKKLIFYPNKKDMSTIKIGGKIAEINDLLDISDVLFIYNKNSLGLNASMLHFVVKDYVNYDYERTISSDEMKVFNQIDRL